MFNQQFYGANTFAVAVSSMSSLFLFQPSHDVKKNWPLGVFEAWGCSTPKLHVFWFQALAGGFVTCTTLGLAVLGVKAQRRFQITDGGRRGDAADMFHANPSEAPDGRRWFESLIPILVSRYVKTIQHHMSTKWLFCQHCFQFVRHVSLTFTNSMCPQDSGFGVLMFNLDAVPHSRASKKGAFHYAKMKNTNPIRAVRFKVKNIARTLASWKWG